MREVHGRYLSIARKVAGETGAPLVDLEAALAGSDKREVFLMDGIHSTEFGLQRIAELLVDGMGAAGVLPSVDAGKVGRWVESQTYPLGLEMEFEKETAYPSAEAEIARMEKLWPGDA